MKSIVTYLAFAVLLFSQLGLQAQKNEEKLAIQFFEQKEYDKAVIYLDKLYDKTPDAWFSYYYKSLMALKDYSKAEKICKKQVKRDPDNVYLYVYLGQIYRVQNDTKKEDEQYKKAIKELVPEQNAIFSLAHAFEDAGLYDYAIETYLKGRKAYSDVYPFYYEIADLYKKKGDLKAMINEYLDAIQFRDSEIGTAQMNLQNSLGYDDKEGGFKNPLLKQELQKRIQAHPDKTIFSEFLIFIQKQQKDFEGAFTQSKALDKRRKEDGYRLMELGRICVQNGNYDVAERCFQYVIAKGKEGSYYDIATIEDIYTRFLKITSAPNPTPQELNSLETAIQGALTSYGINNNTIPLVRKLAHLQAYYLNKSDAAIAVLEDAIANPGFQKNTVAELKLDLGDIYVLSNNIWDASLLYSQVEKDFKYDQIGQEAKFKNAKLSYYSGDFKWAKAQADILKGATSKLIANDALDLSLIISDAIGIDTNAAPLQLFAAADLLILQHQYDKAIAKLDSINLLYSEHSLGDDIYYKKGDIYLREGKYTDALKMYQNISEFFSDGLYGDDALFKQAELYEKYLNDPEKAKAIYQEFLTKYPGSIYVVEARKRYRELRGDNLN